MLIDAFSQKIASLISFVTNLQRTPSGMPIIVFFAIIEKLCTLHSLKCESLQGGISENFF